MISNERYKDILLDTLSYFHDFCVSHNLKYFLIGGTLLGAIRHKGFIPWDDDIDVGMPRDDYEKFRNLFKNNSNFEFYDCFINKKFYSPYGKLCNSKIILHEKINTNLNIGAFIDIFPFDFVDDNFSFSLTRESKLYSKVIELKYATPSKERSFVKNVIIKLIHFLFPISLNRISRQKNKKYQKFVSKKPTKFICNLYGIYGDKEISEYKNFKNIIEVEFEHHLFYAPVGFDAYLKKLYGDYMKLPKESERISHHNFETFWKDEL